MDHTNPLAVVTPSLDGPVLLALAATTGAMSGADVHRAAGTGSSDGVRRVLARLVVQGIVVAETYRHATLYRLNRDHVAVPWIIELTRVRSTIVDRTRDAVTKWPIAPAHASLFGSFVRGEADASSDIDILVVSESVDPEDDVWVEQVDRLAGLVRAWTGNRAHILDATPATLTAMLRNDDPLINSWRADALHLFGEPIMDLLRRLRVDASLGSESLR